MSNKPVIEIDVSDAQFRAFYETFQQYAAQVEDMPADWKKINGATIEAGRAVNEFAKLSDVSKDSLMMAAIQADAVGKSVARAIDTQKEFLGEILNGVDAQKKFSEEVKRSDKNMKDLKKGVGEFAHEVFGIGKFLMKLGALGLGITGVGAILSGFGLRDLARSAISTQGEARSIGVSSGQLSAFETDFGRYVDPSILNRAAEAQSDLRKVPYAMLATGQSFSAVQNESPDDLSLRMMQRAHDWYNNTPVAMRNAQTLRGTGLDQFMSFEEVRKLGAMTPEEFTEARSNYQKDAKAFNFSDKSTDAWFGFEREIEAAGKLLKSDLTDRLAELAPNLKDFIHNISGDAKILIDDVLSPQNLKSAGEALHDFATYLGSSQFRQDLKDIAGLFVDLASAMRKAAKFLGIDTSTPVSEDVKSLDLGSGSDDWSNEGISTADKALGYTRHSLNMPSDARDRLAALNKKNGLPAGTLEAIWAKESSEGKNLVGPVLRDGDQAIGDFQFTGAAWKDWGKGGDRFSFDDESKAAGSYMSSLMKKYKGDIKESLAAYDWGPGNVDKAIAQNGANWQNALPRETRDYINKISSALAKRSTVNLKVDVHNSTAARVAVSTNAAATGS